MSTPTKEIEVSDFFVVKFNDGKSYKVMMSFGLLNKLAALVNGIDQLPLMFIEAGLMDAIIIECLALRDPEGDVDLNQDTMNDQLSMDVALNLIEWSSKHLTNFFTKALHLSLGTAKRAQNNLGLPSTQAGTTD